MRTVAAPVDPFGGDAPCDEPIAEDVHAVLGRRLVYWTQGYIYFGPNGRAAMSVPVGGGTATTLFTTNAFLPGPIVVDSSNAYFGIGYYNTGGSSDYTGVGRVAKTGGNPDILSYPTGTNFVPAGIAIDSASVYWQFDALYQVPKNGGSTATLSSAAWGLGGGVAVDTANVYWNNDNGLMQIPRSGGTVVTLVSGNNLWGTSLGVRVHANVDV